MLKSKGTRARTDQANARMLAQMGAALRLEPDRPVPQNLRGLKEVQVARTVLVKDRTRLENRVQSLTPGFALKQAKARLTLILRQVRDIEAEINTCIAQDDATAAHKLPILRRILRPIPGIGTVAAILIECPEIGTLTGRQIASLTGLAAMTRQSGKWPGRACVQGGRKHLREALCMPALVAARVNPDFKRKYQAMVAAGKPAKVALTTPMRKRIERANTLVKNDRERMPKRARSRRIR